MKGEGTDWKKKGQSGKMDRKFPVTFNDSYHQVCCWCLNELEEPGNNQRFCENKGECINQCFVEYGMNHLAIHKQGVNEQRLYIQVMVRACVRCLEPLDNPSRYDPAHPPMYDTEKVAHSCLSCRKGLDTATSNNLYCDYPARCYMSAELKHGEVCRRREAAVEPRENKRMKCLAWHQVCFGCGKLFIWRRVGLVKCRECAESTIDQRLDV